MDSERRIEARGCKDAEALDHAEIIRRYELHPHRADEHHAERNARASSIVAIFSTAPPDMT